MKKLFACFCVLLMLLTACAAVDQTAAPVLENGGTVGTGETSFRMCIADDSGEELSFTVRTDCETVGDALLRLKIISGKKDAQGLLVTTVNGLTLDYEKDGRYWAFYIDGEYAMQGTDATAIDPDSVYMLKVEEA